ncbi:guanitoxin biosynthesis L-enduracididine beta-hydroxylase GntD [Kitasatospora aureofaciens]|uniref:guanitoxin biosynthesis L-enduracididine beta-hydroxylase GntD n=1 Tax=Kitasatospora aureofaciens TaxID=1894 RepID=UPI0033E4A9DA
MFHIQLSRSDIEEVDELASTIAGRYPSADDAEFLKDSTVFAQRLPETLRTSLNRFRLTEPADACRISGFPVRDDRIGETPRHWADTAGRPGPTLREEFFLVLCSSLLGDVFGWASQQAGRLVHEVVPIPGHEGLQINSASSSTLLWHTEDAFHPYRADYVGLMCLRNPQRAETTVACIADVELDRETAGILFEPRFVLRPDEAHLPKNGAPNRPTSPRHSEAMARGHARIERMLSHPQKVAVLFGDPASPYLRLDSAEVERTDDLDAMAALDHLLTALDQQLNGVVLEPGDLLFVDNFRAVHGRQPFTARYDGRDRWLKRVNITRDLRRSRDARISTDDRIVH